MRAIRRLADIRQTITLVDGTLLPALSRIAEAMWLSTKSGTRHYAWRLHTHFSLALHVPVRMDLTIGKNSGQSNEKNVLRQQLAADHLYVMDRGYAQFSLFDDIVAAKSSYVCRVRDNSRYQVVEERPLAEASRQAGVVFDGVVRLGDPDDATRRPHHPVRLVMVQVQPHEKRSNRKGNTGAGPSDGYLRIVTNLLDVPAEPLRRPRVRRYGGRPKQHRPVAPPDTSCSRDAWRAAVHARRCFHPRSGSERRGW